MAKSALEKQPLVSVVTPFFNTAPYLAECIESVLAQSYPYFEYILLDNCSTDGSGEIAASYAFSDPRIRLIRCTEFVSQLPNYNRALTKISDSSVYCKIVQADDWIFPECLKLMVLAFEQSESIGLVSSYWLDGNDLCGSGVPPKTTTLLGRECARRYLRTGTCPFASQTHVMYRASLVRDHGAFFNASFVFADFQKHMEILEDWDFGFVHQVLSFSRRDDKSILGSRRSFGPGQLVRYIFARRYAPIFLGKDESSYIIARCKNEYYRLLARALLRFRGRAFWRFHEEALMALGEGDTFDWRYLAMTIGQEVLSLGLNPGITTMRAVRSLKGNKDQNE
jgi:glycosyltransferase involved in cell wall biosynthesis